MVNMKIWMKLLLTLAGCWLFGQYMLGSSHGWKHLLFRSLRWGLGALVSSALISGHQAVTYARRQPTFESDVIALDAETGKQQWVFHLPPWPHVSAAGDSEGFVVRSLVLPQRPLVMPADFNSPTIDGEGTVIVGYHDGRVYSLRDDDGNGVVDEAEAASYDTKAAFLHTGAAFAP